MGAIEVFDELLNRDLEKWKATVPDFRARLKANGCHYAGREFVKVLRPKFLERSEYAYLDYVSGVLMGVFRRLSDRVLDDRSLQDWLDFSDGERRLIAPEPLCPDPCAFTRLDSFATMTGPRFVELNGEAPAGAGFNDQATKGFMEHPLIKDFVERTGAYAINASQGVLDGLLMAWRAAGNHEKPKILITDYQDLPTVPEFHILREYFESKGFTAVVEDPRALEYRDQQLYAKGIACDLVYRRVLTNEFLEREDEVAALFDAYAEGSIVMVNPFRAKTIHKKACFALLSGDHLGRDWLTREERAVIDATIPWTRKVREVRTDFHGAEIDLMEFVTEYRDRFVAKPSDEYGGKGVTIGWETEADEWKSVLEDAMNPDTPDWVVQERIPTVEESFPMLEDDLNPLPMIVDLDPYIYFGKVHGVLARLAAGALCNVTSGGGQVPVFIVPDA